MNANGTPLDRDELAAWRGMLRVHSDMTRVLDAELTQRHGLPLTSYEVLLFLADSPDGRMRMSELADSVLLSRSGLTRRGRPRLLRRDHRPRASALHRGTSNPPRRSPRPIPELLLPRRPAHPRRALGEGPAGRLRRAEVPARPTTSARRPRCGPAGAPHESLAPDAERPHRARRARAARTTAGTTSGNGAPR
jgi:hypothetical protein